MPPPDHRSRQPDRMGTVEVERRGSPEAVSVERQPVRQGRAIATGYRNRQSIPGIGIREQRLGQKQAECSVLSGRLVPTFPLTTGASFTLVTVSAKLAVVLAPAGSVAVTATARLLTSPLPGVPENVSDTASNESQDGSGLPSASAAERVSVSPSPRRTFQTAMPY
jgi:hypothetical protein